MITFTGKEIRIHRNGDFSGDAIITHGDKELVVPGSDLHNFALSIMQGTFVEAIEELIEQRWTK